MAADDGRRRGWRQTAACVVLVLCALAQCSTGLSLKGLSEKAKQDEFDSEATVIVLKTGHIFLNGQALKGPPPSASAAAGDLRLLQDQVDGTGMLEQKLTCFLRCGQSKMKVKATGLGAGELQLDLGNARVLPLKQVPEHCGYEIWQNALGLVLVVPYDGCDVHEEDGNYVLPMSWLGTLVNFTCPVRSSAKAPAPPSPAPPSPGPPSPAPPSPAPPRKHPFPLWSPTRHKRQVPYIGNPKPHLSDDPAYNAYLYNYYYYYYYYYYYLPYYPYYPYYPYNPPVPTTTSPPVTASTEQPHTQTPITVKPPCPATEETSKPRPPYDFADFLNGYIPYAQNPFSVSLSLQDDQNEPLQSGSRYIEAPTSCHSGICNLMDADLTR